MDSRRSATTAASFRLPREIRNGISEQSAAEGEQVLNHFLNRLPIITLKEGSRARVYIGTRHLIIPSYAEHRVDPNPRETRTHSPK